MKYLILLLLISFYSEAQTIYDPVNKPGIENQWSYDSTGKVTNITPQNGISYNVPDSIYFTKPTNWQKFEWRREPLWLSSDNIQIIITGKDGTVYAMRDSVWHVYDCEKALEAILKERLK